MPGSRIYVFAAGFSMMTVELLAGRVTAPFLGASLYTWTGIIAAVLAGIALGAFVGGRLADRFSPARVRSYALIASGVSVALAFLIASLVGPWLAVTFSVPAAMPVFSLLVFFPPAALLASIHPASIRADLHAVGETGSVVGTLGAWNAAGSLLGTYLTGFVFTAYLSTSLVWFGIALLLFILFLASRIPHPASSDVASCELRDA